MKRVCALLLAAVMLVLTAVPAAAEDNLMPGGEFDAWDSFWGLYTESGGSGKIQVENGELTVAIGAAGNVGHAVQLYCDGFDMLQNAQYELSFDLRSTVERSISWRIQVNGGDYHAYAGDQTMKIGPETKHFAFQFTMREANDRSPRFCLNMGNVAGAKNLGAHEVTVDNVKLVITDSSKIMIEEEENTMPKIMINQVGYRPADKKLAVFRELAADSAFRVVDAVSGETVYTGTVVPGGTGGSSGDTVGWADFSAVTAPGSYKITAENSGESYPFAIGQDVYADLLKASVKMLYMQRCGMELTKEYAGEFAHPACHTEIATIYGTQETMEVSGGWHDAGDYGRYTGPGAKTAADLLLAYEMNPDVFGDDFDIPESGNGIPDVLDEARYELEWLLKMQRADGGVYHKVTGKNFDGVVMPEDCREKLYVLPVSATSTGDVAAVMFLAARVYKEVDPAFAERCLNAAWLSLSYAEANRAEQSFRNPADVNTGEYGDWNEQDEYFWAICEGFKTTGDAGLAKKMEDFDLRQIAVDGMGWADVSCYGYYAALTSGAQRFQSRFQRYLATITDVIPGEAYHSSIPDDYPWGSNMTIANNGIVLLMAQQLLGKQEYAAMAQTQLDYLLGVNTTGYCFVTGFGSQPMEHPHHRPSQSLGKAVPGMLSGGPNNGLQDACAAKNLRGVPKAACFIDNEQSYSTNEIAIYWNSPLVWLLAGLMK